MGRRLRLALCQIPNLFLRLDFSEFISLDDESIDLFTQCAIKNPAFVERKLKSLRAAKAQMRCMNGCVSWFSPKEAALGTQQALVKCSFAPTPDVLYVGDPDAAPGIVYNERILNPSCMTPVTIDCRVYPRVAMYLRRIRKYSAWKRRLLVEGYEIIGEEQAKFLRDLDPMDYHALSRAELAERLGVHEGTIHRIFSNRLVEALAVNGIRATMPASNLFITMDEFRRIIVTPLLNHLLDIEYATGKALSDQFLALKVGILARRTIAKYREESSVPAHGDRNRAYKAKTCQKPYRFCSAEKQLDSAPNPNI